jgi:hypothetical protein
MNSSLLELAISLVIISLIICSTLLGQNLVYNSQLKNFLFEVQDIKAKILTFKDQNNFLPGDFPYANKLWQVECQKLLILYNLGCDGNGDEYIGNIAEGFLAFNHLTFSGLYFWGIEGGMVYSYAKTRVNVARSKFIDSDIQLLGDTKLHIMNYNIEHLGKNFVRFAKARSQGNILDSILSPKDSHYVDYKIDDGIPMSGSVIADMGSLEYGGLGQQLCVRMVENNLFFYRKFDSNIYCYMQVSLEK